MNIILARIDIDQIKIHGGDVGATGGAVPQGGAMAKDVAALEAKVTDVTKSIAELTYVVKEAFDRMLKGGGVGGGDNHEIQECTCAKVNLC